MNYNDAIQEANQFLQNGGRKKALEVFKNVMSGERVKISDLEYAAKQEIKAELTL